MKGVLLATVCLLTVFFAKAQTQKEETLYQTKSKTHLYYVVLTESYAIAFEMGSYLDKAGTGFSIRRSDTLKWQQDSSSLYANSKLKIVTLNGDLYLLTQNKKATKYKLVAVGNNIAYTHLNNAYYLDHFFAMSDALNKRYPLQHYSFRNGFHSWKELPNQDMNYTAFMAFADSILNILNDSISTKQETYTLITNTLIQKSQGIDYNALKRGVLTLWSDSNATHRYIATVATALARQQPELFFKLAEDLPNKRGYLFEAIEDKQAIKNLKRVEQFTAVKKEFFKTKKSDKNMPYKIVAPYAILAGLISFFIIR